MKELTSDLLNRIRKDPNSVDWDNTSCHCILSEDFIREFRDEVDWFWISFRQILSEDFLVEFIDKVNLRWLERNKNVPKDVFERIKLLKGFL
jgi:hypothetical protein